MHPDVEQLVEADAVPLTERVSSDDLEALQQDGITLTSADQIAPQATQWGWDGRIASNSVNMLAGNPGLGKTTVAIELAARWTRGQLEGDLCGHPIHVVIATVEDSPSHTLVPRLHAAGADLKKVHFLTKNREGVEAAITFPEDLPDIQKAMKAHDAKALIVDPLGGYLNGETNSFRDADVRRALAPLATLAEDLQAIVLPIVHLNKANNQEVQYRVSGSIAFVAAARSVLLVAEDPDNEGSQVITHLKCNLAPKAVSLRYAIEQKVISHEGQDIKTSGVVWLGEAPEVTAASALNNKDNPEEKSALTSAMEWLDGFLDDGSVEAKEVYKEAKRMDIAPVTLRRAKRKMEIRVVKDGFGKKGKWMWTKSEDAKDDQDPLKGDQYTNDDHLSRSPQEKSSFSNNLAKGDQNSNIDHLSDAHDHLSDGQGTEDLFEGSTSRVPVNQAVSLPWRPIQEPETIEIDD